METIKKLIFIFFFVFIFLVIFKINSINALMVDTISLPQIEKYDAHIYKIGKYRVWEMKNVSKYNGDLCFKKSTDDGKAIINQFYMVNKKVQDIDLFKKDFVKQVGIKSNTNNTILVKYYFYLESKDLPKYWKPVWDKRCIDELTQHKDDLLFTITVD